MSQFTLDFEKPIRELETQIELLKSTQTGNIADIGTDLKNLQNKINGMIQDTYANLGQWERVQLSRHPDRPHTLDYIQALVTDFHDVKGDRYFADDAAVIAGFGYFNNQKVAIVGIEKGRKTKEKILHNFGMPRPEGYRKAIRVMKLASKFNIPVISFVDTPGAYPGLDAEERGQASAIAENLVDMFQIKSPFISIVIGEGGSGGALGIACADRVFMMEYSVYSVISPESCASILWGDAKMAQMASESLKIDSRKAFDLKVIDGVIEEPAGGAHRNFQLTFKNVAAQIEKSLAELKKMSSEDLLKARFDKFRILGNNTLTKI